MAETTPQFVRFVRSVEGRAVPRWGTRSRALANELFGARRIPREKRERRAGAPVLEWDTERVIPLTDAYCRQYVRELNNAVKRGDLVEVKREDWEAYEKRREESRKKTEADAKRQAEKARQLAGLEQSGGADDAPEVIVEDGDWVADDLEDDAPDD